MKKLYLLLCILITLTACNQSTPAVDYEDYYYASFQVEHGIPIYDESKQEIGTLEANTIVSLAPFDNQEYFLLQDLPYYVHYKDVGIESQKANLVSYPNYVFFPEEIVSSSPVHLYTVDETLYLTIHERITAPILIKEMNYYTIQWNDTYFKIPISDIAEINYLSSTTEIADDVPVLMYHFFYSRENGEKPLDNNWLEINQFEEQLQYLTENSYHILTMQELEQYLKGEVLLPKKSLVITIDDGDPSVYQYAYPLLEKYQVRATTFLVTSSYWWDIDNRVHELVELQSHSHDMHRGGCSTQHNGRMLCIDFEEGVADLKTSQDYLYGSFVFCYPFGDVNAHAKEMLVAAGYRLAFTTKSGKVSPGMDLLELPRVRISNEYTLTQFINLID